MEIHYLNVHGELLEGCGPRPSEDALLKIYQTMHLTRHVDSRVITLQRQGLISFAISSFGEEACAVASAAALKSEDWMYPQYREAGIIFWRGWTLEQYVHHMFGNSRDITLGRQMPNHFGDKKLNIVTVSSPIGTNIPQASGCAYAMKLQRENSIAICYFGEGATSEGDFHAGLNFAAVRKSPVIFFCRNNGFAISTPVSAQYASQGVAVKGEAYGIPSYCVDGNDVFAIYETVSKAREHCLKGKGPILIEAITYRMGGHSTSDDPTQYRKQEEVEAWEGKCPILRLRRFLEKQGMWDEQKEAALQEAIEIKVSDAIAIAKETPMPPKESLIEFVYEKIPETLKEQFKKCQS